jgi:hypothetical protein
MKSKRMRWAGCVEHTVKAENNLSENVYKVKMNILKRIINLQVE